MAMSLAASSGPTASDFSGSVAKMSQAVGPEINSVVPVAQVRQRCRARESMSTRRVATVPASVSTTMSAAMSTAMTASRSSAAGCGATGKEEHDRDDQDEMEFSPHHRQCLFHFGPPPESATRLRPFSNSEISASVFLESS